MMKVNHVAKLFHFEGRKLNLRVIVNWPVTGKTYAIVAEDGKVRCNPKRVFKIIYNVFVPQSIQVAHQHLFKSPLLMLFELLE